MPRQENTKEKILQCAFNLYEKPRMSEISLSEIAVAAGISKTAIFRHYKNKDDLVEKMRESFFEEFSKLISSFANGKGIKSLRDVEKIVFSVFDFEESHPNYLSYFLQASFSDPLLAEGVSMILYDNGIRGKGDDIFRESRAFLEKAVAPSFFEQSLLGFLILGMGKKKDFVKITDFQKYKAGVARLIYSGLGKRKNPLLPERLDQLDEICRIQFDEGEKEDRFLNAFVSLLQEGGSSKITVERIAGALGMSKSSVYSFFANKRDYLINMLLKENQRIHSILNQKCLEAKNIDEAVYIIMKCQANYFALRPQAVALHNYYIFNQAELSKAEVEKYHKKAVSFFKGGFMDWITPKEFSLPVSDNPILFVRWISGLTVNFMFIGNKKKISQDWLDFYVRAVFKMVECGIKYEKNLNGDIA